MSAIFDMPKAPVVPTPPEVPKLDDAVVQRAAAEVQRGHARGGRASQILTNPQTQQDAGKDRRAYLGGF